MSATRNVINKTIGGKEMNEYYGDPGEDEWIYRRKQERDELISNYALRDMAINMLKYLDEHREGFLTNTYIDMYCKEIKQRSKNQKELLKAERIISCNEHGKRRKFKEFINESHKESQLDFDIGMYFFFVLPCIEKHWLKDDEVEPLIDYLKKDEFLYSEQDKVLSERLCRKNRHDLIKGGYFVYYFLDENDEVIYVGRTTNLYNRMTQHTRCGHLPRECYEEVYKIQYIEVMSDTDMKILELHSMNYRRYKPKYNTRDIQNSSTRIMIDYEEYGFEVKDYAKATEE